MMRRFQQVAIALFLLLSATGCNVTWPMLDATAVYRPIESVGGAGVIYAPPAAHERWSAAQVASATPEQLARYYAPILVQGHLSPQHDEPYRWPPEVDSIGRPFLVRLPNGRLRTEIDVSQPTVYALAERRRLGTHDHVQLTYTVWYPRRPRTKAIDIEAAHIDSGVLRITLDEQNVPLLYETVLACGCYHKAFVEDRVEAAAREYFGPPERGKHFSVEKNVPGRIDWEVAGLVDTPTYEPVGPVVFVSAGEHRVQGLHSANGFRWPENAQAVVPYRLADYRELLSVPIAGTSELGSIFNAADDQQVFGADRLERFIFMWIGTDDAGHPRRNDQILLHFDQSAWMDPTNYNRYLRLPPGLL